MFLEPISHENDLISISIVLLRLGIPRIIVEFENAYDVVVNTHSFRHANAMAADSPVFFATGLNLDGQLGLRTNERNFSKLTAVPDASTYGSRITAFSASLRHSCLVLDDGSLLTCGSPSAGALGRSPQNSTRFRRVDALESFNLSRVSAGSSFTCTWDAGGNGAVSFGANSVGQLGVGDREVHERPKAMSKQNRGTLLCQLQSGSGHSIALSSSGDVLVWGSGKEGQLGTGQYTSIASPMPVAPLLKRPMVQVAAGKSGNFCLAITASGILYSWGENSSFQLGHGDSRPRTRPEVVSALRVARVTSIAAGQHHTVALSRSGQLFSWGKNTSGQCGCGKKLGQKQNSTPIVENPTIIERIRDILCSMPSSSRIVALACGISHTVVHFRAPMKQASGGGVHYKSELFSFGNNSSGQLGLGHFESCSKPTRIDISVCEFTTVSMIWCGGHNTFVLFNSPSNDSNGSTELNRDDGVAAISLAKVNRLLGLIAKGKDAAPSLSHISLHPEFRRIEMAVFAAFSSASVLNQSFLKSSVPNNNFIAPATELDSAIDMLSVLLAYDKLMYFGGGALRNRLGQATHRLVETLSSTPFDELENLRVFMILFMNPLLLEAPQQHVILQRLVSALLSLPQRQRNVLFIWIADLPSEFFSRVVSMMQGYLTFLRTEKTVKTLDATPVCLILKELGLINGKRDILPVIAFHNDALSNMATEDLRRDYHRMISATSNSKTASVFSFLAAVPMLFDLDAKRRLVQIDATDRMHSTLGQAARQLFESRALGSSVSAPEELRSHMHFDIKVRRDFIVEDAVKRFTDVLENAPDTLRKPLRITFVGEDGVDEGGLTKDFITVLLRALITEEMQYETHKADASARSESKERVEVTDGPIVEFSIDDLAVYIPSDGRLHEIVKVVNVHYVPGSQKVEFYTVRVQRSNDAARVGIEPQVAAESAGTKLIRLHDAASRGMLSGIVSSRKAKASSHGGRANPSSTTTENRLFSEDPESGLSWFSPPSLKAETDSAAFESYVRFPINLSRYEMVGIVLGLAMYNGVLCRPYFPLCMMKLILRQMNGGKSESILTPGIKDLRALHPTLASSLEQLLDLDEETLESLDLRFELSRSVPVIYTDGSPRKVVSVTEEFDTIESSRKVTKQNVQEYVRQYALHLLDRSCHYKHEALSRGFLRVVGSAALTLCSPRELESILCGMESVGDLSTLKENARYSGGFTRGDEVIQWFWDIVTDYSEALKRKLLKFITGSERVPIKGLAAVRITLQKSGEDDQRLPVAHTCFSTLDLPDYSSREKLETALRVALDFGAEGFGFA